jgi:hypothetical protein
MKRVLIIICVVLLLVGCWWLYERNKTGSIFGDGSVSSRESASDRNDMSSGATTDLDGQPIGPTPSRSDAPNTINTVPVTPGAATNQPPSTATNGMTATPNTMVASPTGGTTIGPATAPPAGDSIAPNPPNGMVFTGTGKYQWYRQGDITWRVDSGNGAYCIAFATMEQWAKPIVYRNGCGAARG